MSEKKVPMRRCVGCMTSRPKAELMRYVLVDGVAVKDETGKANGRGLYVCRDSEECLKKAVKKGRVQTA